MTIAVSTSACGRGSANCAESLSERSESSAPHTGSWSGALAPVVRRAVYTANFGDDREISDRAVIASVLESLGQDAAAVLARAEAPGNPLRARTEEAKALGLFGAPTFVCGAELFFGQDRMDEALEWAAARP